MAYLMNAYLNLALITKLIFLYFAFTYNYGDRKNQTDYYYKNLFHSLFLLEISLLMLYLFNPLYKKNTLISRHIKIYLFLYALLILIGIDWKSLLPINKNNSSQLNSVDHTKTADDITADASTDIIDTI